MLKRILPPYVEHVQFGINTLYLHFNSEANFMTALNFLLPDEVGYVRFHINFDNINLPYTLEFDEDGYLQEISFPFTFTGEINIRGDLIFEQQHYEGHENLLFKMKARLPQLELKLSYHHLTDPNGTKSLRSLFKLVNEFLRTNSPNRNLAVKEEGCSYWTMNQIFILMKLITAGLAQSKGSLTPEGSLTPSWTFFLTQGIYDPRLLILIFKMMFNFHLPDEL